MAGPLFCGFNCIVKIGIAQKRYLPAWDAVTVFVVFTHLFTIWTELSALRKEGLPCWG